MQLEKRKQEDELKQVMQQEKHLERIKVMDCCSNSLFYFITYNTNKSRALKFPLAFPLENHNIQ